MNLISVIFNLLLLISLSFGILAISATDVFISIFSLVATYFFAVWLLAIIRLEFLAFIILLVYLGAIAMLFIYIILMFSETRSVGVANHHSALILTILLFFPLIINCTHIFKNFTTENLILNTINKLPGNIEYVGFLLYTSYFPLLLFSGFILFVAVICIIRITKVN